MMACCRNAKHTHYQKKLAQPTALAEVIKVGNIIWITQNTKHTDTHTIHIHHRHFTL